MTQEESPPTHDPLPLALAFAQLFCEVECGRRPRATVHPLMTPHLAAKLARVWVRGGPMRRPIGARGLRLGPDAFEVVVVVRGRDHVGALGLRLERRGRGWKVVEATRPEDGALPEPVVYLRAGERCAFDLVCPWLDQPASKPPASERLEPVLPVAVGL